MNTNGSAPARILDDDLFFSDPDDVHVICVGEPYTGSDGTTVAAFRPGSRDTVAIRRVMSEVTKREWLRLATQGPGIATDLPAPGSGAGTLTINTEISLIELLYRSIVSWTFVRADGSPVPLTREWIREIGPLGAWLEQAISAWYNRPPADLVPLAPTPDNRDFTSGSAGSTKAADPTPPAPSTFSPLSGSESVIRMRSDG